MKSTKVKLNPKQIDILFQEGLISMDTYYKNPDVELEVFENDDIRIICYEKEKKRKKNSPIIHILKYCPRTKYFSHNLIKRAHSKCKYINFKMCNYRSGLIKYFENIDLGGKKFLYTYCILFNDEHKIGDDNY